MNKKLKVSEVVNLNGKLLGYAYKNPNRKNRNEVVGVFVGAVVGNEIRYGWSKTNFNAGDRFNVKFGFEKAFGRTQMQEEAYVESITKVPQGRFSKQFNRFRARCHKYFQTNYTKNNDIGDCQVV